MSTPVSRSFPVFASAIAAGLLAAGALAASPAAAQFVAYTTTSVNQRAGPGTDFPVVVTIPRTTRIVVYGCLDGLEWCDVQYQERGWMSARYIQAYYQQTYYPLGSVATYLRVPTIAFNINTYWTTYYRARPFYRDMARWQGGGGGGGGGGTIDVGVFYDRLAPHGHWVNLRDRYVWVPREVRRDWRPYQDGRWVYTNRGWMWVSNEPFGWATYHYGRWAFSNRIGWFWVPGTRWAPAWVAWRGSRDHLAWAPLPPEPSSGVTININIGDVPNYYWQTVPTSAFLSVNLTQVIVRDQREAARAFEQTRPLGTAQVSGDQVVDNSVDVKLVEEQTGERIVPREVASTENPDSTGQVSDTTVEVFTPPPTQPAAEPAKPPEVTDVTEVEKESQTKEQAGNEPTTEDLVTPEQPAAEQPATPAPGGEQPPAATGGEQPAAPADQAQPPPPAAGEAAPAPSGEGVAPAAEPPPPQSETPTTEQPPPPSGEAPAATEPPKPQAPAGEAAPAQEPPPPQAAPANEPPPPENAAPAPEQPPPPKESAAPAEQQPAEPPPPDNGAAAPAEPPPPKAAPQPAPAEQAPSQPESSEPPPPKQEAPAAEPPPAAEQPPPAAEPPPPEAAPAEPPKPEQPRQPSCPEGQSPQADGSCAPAQ